MSVPTITKLLLTLAVGVFEAAANVSSYKHNCYLHWRCVCLRQLPMSVPTSTTAIYIGGVCV